jgi:hypothetical protein
MALPSTQPLTEMSTRNLTEDKGRPARKANNITAIWTDCLETVWASTSHNRMDFKACYRDSLTRKADNLTAICESIV